jgi:6-phosphogluconolactonase
VEEVLTVTARFRVFEEAVDIWRVLAERWRALAAESISKRGIFRAALSGGRTPVGFYCHLAGQENAAWADTEIFQVDERFVPRGSEESNARMITSSLLGRHGVPVRSAHLISTEEATAAAAAERYERELRAAFSGEEGEWPRVDLLILGLGEDGHTASLFPGGPELQESERWVVDAHPREYAHERITLTLPVLNRARQVFFVATGAGKAGAVKKIREVEKPLTPAGLVRPESGDLFFFLDRQAGAGIKE